MCAGETGAWERSESEMGKETLNSSDGLEK